VSLDEGGEVPRECPLVMTDEDPAFFGDSLQHLRVKRARMKPSTGGCFEINDGVEAQNCVYDPGVQVVIRLKADFHFDCV
jgi:hypothetical protein